MLTRGALLALLALLLISCGGVPETGPVEPVWDRDTCEHCRMTVSDRHFAAQVRSAADGRIRHFDDAGCAVLFGPGAEDEIWVRSRDGADWLDARTARFSHGHKTPMGYGFGAGRSGEGLDWDAMVARIHEREDERREHTGH